LFTPRYVSVFDAASGSPDGWEGAGVTTCVNDTVLGGFSELGASDQVSKGFQGLPTHSLLRIQMTVLAIDAWGAGDGFTVWVDGVPFGPYDKASGSDVTALGE
jgi:hypothetical protein